MFKSVCLSSLAFILFLSLILKIIPYSNTTTLVSCVGLIIAIASCIGAFGYMLFELARMHSLIDKAMINRTKNVVITKPDIKDTVVTKAMITAGNAISGELVTASISRSFNGEGGSIQWDDYLKKDIPNKDLVLRYAQDEIDSVEAIYLAMERARPKQ